jgi:drug/metabolite transporter (DMT)-like permease
MTTAASKVTAQVTADDIDEDDDKGTQLLDKNAERSTPHLPGATITSTSSVVRLPLSIKERAVALYHDPPGWFPLGMLVTNQFFFAMMHVVVKPALHFIPPIALAMMRVSLALPFLFLIAWKEGSLQKIGRRDARYMLLLGLIGVALPQTLVFVANKLAGPNVVAIMSPVRPVSSPPSLSSYQKRFDPVPLSDTYTLLPPFSPSPPSLQAAPVYAAIFASALKLERLTRVKVGGILLAVAGALVVLRPDRMRLSNGRPDETSAGICVMVLQTMSYAGVGGLRVVEFK